MARGGCRPTGAGSSKKVRASKRRNVIGRSLPNTPPYNQTYLQSSEYTYETVNFGQYISSGNECDDNWGSSSEATGDNTVYLQPSEVTDKETTPKVSATQNDYTAPRQQPASTDLKAEEQRQATQGGIDRKPGRPLAEDTEDVYQSLVKQKTDQAESCETHLKTADDAVRYTVPQKRSSAAPASRPASTTYNLPEINFRPASGNDSTTDVLTPPSTPAPPPPDQHHQRQEELDERGGVSPLPTADDAYLTTNNEGVVVEGEMQQEHQQMSPCQIRSQCNHVDLPTGYCGAQLTTENPRDKKFPVQCSVPPIYNDIRQPVPTHYAAVNPAIQSPPVTVDTSHHLPAHDIPLQRHQQPSAESRRATVLVMVRLVRGGASVAVDLQVLMALDEDKLRQQQTFKRMKGYVVVEHTEGFVYLAAGDLHVELTNVSWMNDAVVCCSKKVDMSLDNFWNGLAVLSYFMVESRRAVEKAFALDSNFYCEIRVQQNNRTPLVIAALCDLHEISSRSSERPFLANCPCSQGCQAETAKIGQSSVSQIHRHRDQAASVERTRKPRPKSIAVCDWDVELRLRSDETTASSSSSSSASNSTTSGCRTAVIRSLSSSDGPPCLNLSPVTASKAAADDHDDDGVMTSSDCCGAAASGSQNFVARSKRVTNVVPAPRGDSQPLVKRHSSAGVDKMATIFTAEPDYWPANFV